MRPTSAAAFPLPNYWWLPSFPGAAHSERTAVRRAERFGVTAGLAWGFALHKLCETTGEYICQAGRKQGVRMATEWDQLRVFAFFFLRFAPSCSMSAGRYAEDIFSDRLLGLPGERSRDEAKEGGGESP